VASLLRRAFGKYWRLQARRDPTTPYRFLVRNWAGISDAGLAARVLDTEPFWTQLQPRPVRIEAGMRFLVLAPHQDDEILGCGGVLLLAAAAGASTGVVYITDGVQRGLGYAATDEESKRVRREEAATVCARLDAEMFELSISNVDPRPTPEDVDRLSGLIKGFRPDVIIAPWLLDRPAKHRIPSHLLWLVDQRRGLPACEIWGCQVHNMLFPNAVADITEVAEAKRELLRVFVSQNQHYQNHDHLGMALSAWSSRLLEPSPQARYAEPFFALPKDELVRLIGRFYFRDLEVTYQGHSTLPAAMAELHRAVLARR
jgi:N-acetylglucosamine malate deacetylase 1